LRSHRKSERGGTEVQEFRLVDAIRLLFPGVALFLFVYSVYPGQMARLAESTGVIGFPLILGVAGSSVYYAYRPLIYDPLIERLLHRYSTSGAGARRALMDRYATTFDRAARLHSVIVELHLPPYVDKRLFTASGVHMLYQSGFLAAVVAVVAFTHDQAARGIYLCAVCIVALVAAFLADSRYEAFEHDMILGMGWDRVDVIAATLDLSPGGRTGVSVVARSQA
jgi:hypothetical protein